MGAGLIALYVAAPSSVLAQGVAWAVDRASVTFQVRNAGLAVHGSFGGIEADVCFDPDDPESGSLVASVDPATIETGIEMRNRHLMRRGYFHVEKYGAVVIRSIRLRATGTGYAGTFLLSIRGVERQVEIPFVFDTSGSRARISGSLTLDRRDYGLGKRSLILADEVTVHVALTLVRGAGSRTPQPCATPPGRGAGAHPARDLKADRASVRRSVRTRTARAYLAQRPRSIPP